MNDTYHILNGRKFNFKGKIKLWGHPFSGIDMGPISLRYHGKHKAIFHIKGHLYWSGRGKRSYEEARWILAEVEWDNSDNDLFKKGVVIKVLDEQTPGKYWRRCEREMLNRLHLS